MAEMETLDALLGPGPEASGNPGADAGQTGPASDATSQGAPAGGEPDLAQRIAELEEVNRRNTERLTGAERSALDWKTRAERAEEAVQTLATRFDQLSTQQQDTQTQAVPPSFINTLTNVLGYEPDRQAAQQLYQEFRGPTEPSKPAQPQTETYLTRQDLEAYTTRQQQQQMAVQAVVGQHPELNDNGFLQHVIQEYDVLKQDPMTAVLYPESPDGTNMVSFGGRTFDLRLIDKATSSYKAKAAAVGAAQDGPTLGGGSKVPSNAKPKSPVIPTAFVGENGVFSDPTVMRALASAGWGGNTRQQIETMLKHLSPAQRAEWEAQQR